MLARKDKYFKLFCQMMRLSQQKSVTLSPTRINNIRSMKKQLFFMAMLMAMSLSASAQQQVTISLPRQSFEGWDSQTNTMRVVPGKYQIFVGGSSAEAAKNVIEVKVK